MMKYMTGKYAALWTFCLAMLMTSCAHDNFPDGMADTGDSVRVEILLNTPRAGNLTRSLTDDDEMVIQDVLMLFFNKQRNMQLHSISPGREIASQSGNTVTFKADFCIESNFVRDPFECVVLANVAGIYDENAWRSWYGKTYETLQGELTQDVTDKLYADNSTLSFGGIPMWGLSSKTLDPMIPKQNLYVPTLRSVARVDIAVSEAVTNFELSEVYIYKPNDAVSLMPAWDSYDVNGPKVTTPSVPTGAAALAGSWKYDVIAGTNKIERSIYIPEADVVQGGDSTLGDENHLNRCAIVVGGKYAGGSTDTYYRIDFLQSDGKLIDVLRNHRYIMNITKVSGSGKETPDAAYESRWASIEAEVVTWTDNNQDILFDGANWASVERKAMHFGDGEGIEELLQLLSSVRPSEWKLQFSVPEEGITGTESDAQTVEGSYFEVVKPADKAEGSAEQGGNLTVRTKQALPEYGDGVPPVKNETLHEVLTVRIDRLELKIDLYQHPYADTEWEYGGEIEGGF